MKKKTVRDLKISCSRFLNGKLQIHDVHAAMRDVRNAIELCRKLKEAEKELGTEAVIDGLLGI